MILDQSGKEYSRIGEINRDQICNIIKLLLNQIEENKQNGTENEELTLRKVKHMFESMFSEVELAEYTNQLVRHFSEKEIMLKRLLYRYADLKRLQKSSIKAEYEMKYNDLKNNRENYEPEEFEKIVKDTLFQEENSLRELDLNLDKLHKEEEAAILQILERRNAQEAIQLRNNLFEEKIKSHNELFKNHNRKGYDEEIMIYKKGLATFKAKKEKELERRLRAIEFAKQKILAEIDMEIQNKINDYEELLRRRSEEEKWICDKKEQMKQALIKHKEILKQRLGMLGDEDRNKIISDLDKEYKALSISVEKERKRLFLMMQQRDQKRKEMNIERNLTNFYNNLDADHNREKVAFIPSQSRMNMLLNQWKLKNDEKLKAAAKLKETTKKEELYTQNPGALINELLKRVKNLERLLRNFDATRIYKLLQTASDRRIMYRLKH